MANSTAVALLRVSTPEQHLGIEAQRHDIQRFAAERGIDVLSWHVEHVSGGAPLNERHGLLAASKAIAEGKVSYLLVAKRDRLARDPMVAMMTERSLESMGASVLCADGNNGQDPGSKLLRHILDGVAEFERTMISIRTKAALQALRSRGVKLGGKALGCVDKNGPRKTRSDKGKSRATRAVSTVAT